MFIAHVIASHIMGKKKTVTPSTEPNTNATKKGNGLKKSDTLDPIPATKNKKGKRDQTPEPTVDALKPQRGLAIGDNFGWTGKLPATLLYEHCQKNKWGKPIFDMRKSSKGFTGVVKLSWESPKREMVELVMIPDSETYSPKATTNEARHYAATYVLYRINYMKNMKLMLPIIFRDYWSELEKSRLALAKENKRAHDEKYNPHPFQVKLDQDDRRKKEAKELEARKQSEAKTKKPVVSLGSTASSHHPAALEKTRRTFPRSVWERAPFIDFPRDIRSKIERQITQHLKWDSSKKGSSSKDRARIVSFGFRPQHVDEAFEHTGNYNDALEWLLFHIPEDDLPPLFSKQEKDLGAQFKISRDIKQEYMMQRMLQLGFDYDDIVDSLAKHENDEVEAAVFLTNRLLHLPKVEPVDDTEFKEDSQSLWEQEVEGLELMGDHKGSYLNDSKTIVDIPLSPPTLKGMLKLRVFRGSQYPDQFPGIHLVVTETSYKLANYIKLLIIRKLGEYLQPMLGGPMLFTMIEWLEENVAQIIANPGNLVTLPIKIKNSVKASNQKPTKNSGKRLVLTEDDFSAIKQDYTRRMSDEQTRKMVEGRKSLPAWGKREQLIDIISLNQVTLVTGETGSGKSTQIVQFILDYLNSQSNYLSKILCTQPRRISAIGLAERISEERGAKVGQETGYIIKGENKTSPRTRILFVTTGVLLRMLQLELSLNGNLFKYLHYIFVDEVHERLVDLDLLLIILKQIMPKYPNLKVVLMSATIDTTKFIQFFNTTVNHIHIEGRTFPIDDVYLDELLEKTNFTIERNGELIVPKSDSEFFQRGTINYSLVAQVCKMVDADLTAATSQGSILVFMPGIMEISKLIRELENVLNGSIMAVPLHSALSSQDQKQVFKRPPKGLRKIVVSTNIAETSITIPDCVAVVDCGRSKLMFFDSKLNTTRLVENWCSQAEVKQRRGRSGRITSGTCYHIYTRETFEKMTLQPVPEIMRTRLENLFLIVKAMGITDVARFLSSGLDVPDASNMLKASQHLQDIGAIDESGLLTHLGLHLSYLPTDIGSGKILILGCIFGCLEPCLVLAASASTGSPFLNLQDERDEIKRIQKKWADDQGDMVAICNVVQAYEEDHSKGFLALNKLKYLTMQEILLTKRQYLSLLQEIGFVPMNYNSNKGYLNRNLTNYQLLRSVIAGAFYPQIARVELPSPKYFKLSLGSVAVDPDAKKIKLFVKNDDYNQADLESTNLPANRVFIHPSSVFFGSNDVPQGIDMEQILTEDGEVDMAKARELFDLTPKSASSSSNLFKNSFMLFRSSHHTTKLYLRDLTPTLTFGTLMFGGTIDYEVSGKTSPGIVLDLWLPIRTWCKNAVLIKKLRMLLDEALDEQLGNPTHEVSEVLQIIERLLLNHY